MFYGKRKQKYNPKLGKKKFWGLLEYKSKWHLTLRGWGIIFSAILLTISFLTSHIQPFLSVSAPIQADILVVEGWIGDDAVKGAIAEFGKGNYQMIVTTGIPLYRGYYLSEYKSFAELCAATFIRLGFDQDKLVAVTPPQSKRDRTLASAIAFKDWLVRSQLPIKSIDLYSEDVHTRRSWLIYRRVLEPKFQVGAIAYPAINYNPKFWWTSSEGVRLVMSETIGYLYAALFNWNP